MQLLSRGVSETNPARALASLSPSAKCGENNRKEKTPGQSGGEANFTPRRRDHGHGMEASCGSGIKKKAIRRLCKAFNRRSPDRQKGDDEFNFDAFVMSCTQCMDTGGLGQPLFIRYFVFVLIRFGLNFLCHPPMQVRWSSHPSCSLSYG